MKRYIVLVILIIMLVIGLITFAKVFGKKDGSSKSLFKQQKYNEYKSGDIVSFKKEDWYVLHDSSSKDNYVTLIYKGILYLEENGISESNYDVFESSDLSNYLKKDYTDFIGSENLREVNGYKVRLFNEDDLKLLNVSYDEKSDSYDIIDCPDFICLTNVYFATMIPTKDKYEKTLDYEHLNYYNLSTTYDTYKLESLVEDDTLFVRPVINVFKESLDE